MLFDLEKKESLTIIITFLQLFLYKDKKSPKIITLYDLFVIFRKKELDI